MGRVGEERAVPCEQEKEEEEGEEEKEEEEEGIE